MKLRQYINNVISLKDPKLCKIHITGIFLTVICLLNLSIVSLAWSFLCIVNFAFPFGVKIFQILSVWWLRVKHLLHPQQHEQ